MVEIVKMGAPSEDSTLSTREQQITRSMDRMIKLLLLDPRFRSRVNLVSIRVSQPLTYPETGEAYFEIQIHDGAAVLMSEFVWENPKDVNTNIFGRHIKKGFNVLSQIEFSRRLFDAVSERKTLPKRQNA